MAPKHRRSQGARPKSIKTKSDQTKTKSGQTNSMRPDEFEVVQPSEPVEPAVSVPKGKKRCTARRVQGSSPLYCPGTREFFEWVVNANQMGNLLQFMQDEAPHLTDSEIIPLYNANKHNQMNMEQVKSRMVEVFENHTELLKRFAYKKLKVEVDFLQQWEQTMLDARKQNCSMAASEVSEVSEVSEAYEAPDLGNKMSAVTNIYLSLEDEKQFLEQIDCGNIAQAMGSLTQDNFITKEEHEELVAKRGYEEQSRQRDEEEFKLRGILLEHLANGKRPLPELLQLLYENASSEFPEGVFTLHQAVLHLVLGFDMYTSLEFHLLQYYEEIADKLNRCDVSIMNMDLVWLQRNRLSKPRKFSPMEFWCWADMEDRLKSAMERLRKLDLESYNDSIDKVNATTQQIEELKPGCVFLRLDKNPDDPCHSFPLDLFRKECRMRPDWTGDGYGSCYVHVRIEHVYFGESGHVMARCTPVKEVNAMARGGHTVVTIAHGVQAYSPYEMSFCQRPTLPGMKPCDNEKIHTREDRFQAAFCKYMQTEPHRAVVTHLADRFPVDFDRTKAARVYRRPRDSIITDKKSRKQAFHLNVWPWQPEIGVVGAACGREAHASLVPCGVTPECKLPSFDVSLFALAGEPEVLDIIKDQKNRASEVAREELLSSEVASPATSPNKSPPKSPTEPVQPRNKKTIHCWKCNETCYNSTDLEQHMISCLHPWRSAILDQFAGNKQTVKLIRPKDEKTGQPKKLEHVSKDDRYELAIKQLATQNELMKQLWVLIKEAAPRQAPGPVKSGKTKKKKQHKPQHQSQQQQHNTTTEACSESSEGSAPDPFKSKEEFWAAAGLWSAIVYELDQVEQSIQQNVCKSLLARWHVAQLHHKEQVAEQAVREAIMQEQWESHYRPEEPPKQYICSITDELMTHPVVCEDGFSYEKDAIEAWIGRNSSQNTTAATTFASPRTNVQIGTTMLPNRDLRSLIDDWRTADTQAMMEWFEKNQ